MLQQLLENFKTQPSRSLLAQSLSENVVFSKTAGVTEEHLQSILLLRGLTRAEARQISTEMMEEREPELDHNNGIFAQVKVFTGLLSVKNILG